MGALLNDSDVSQRTLYMREWRKRHPEWADYHREYHKKYYADPERAERAKERARAWYEANRERAKARVRAYFQTNKAECMARAKRWRAKNIESVRAWNRMNEALRRVRGAEAISLEQVIAKNGMTCGICLAPIDGPFHVDHIYPVSRGGKHELGNLQLAHPSCNRRKSDNI